MKCRLTSCFAASPIACGTLVAQTGVTVTDPVIGRANELEPLGVSNFGDGVVIEVSQ